MKYYYKIFPLTIMLLFAFGIHAQEANFIWALQGGNSSFTEGNIQVQNTEEGIIAAGDYLQTTHFGEHEITSTGATDIFIGLFDENGVAEQITSIGGENEEFLRFLKVDSEGNIIISIMFTDFITVNGNEFTSAGGQDVLLIKFNPDLSIQWAEQYGTELTDYVKGMDIDEDGNILVFGKFKNDLQLGEITITSAGSTDMYIAKFNPDGNVVFAFNEGGSSYEDANSIAVGSNGDFFISGTFYGETTINGGIISTENTTGIFLAKYDANSIFQWVEIIDGTSLLQNIYLEGSYDGSLYVAGDFQGQVTFGSQTLTTGDFDMDVYIAKYSNNGEVLWAGHGNSPGSDLVSALSSDIDGNVYLTGRFLETINFNGIIINYTLC